MAKDKTRDMKWSSKILTVSTIILTLSVKCSAQDIISLKGLLKNGGLYAEHTSGRALIDIRGDTYFIPASTIKVATAYCALDVLSTNYRFQTQFFIDGETLYIRGYGDPSLVSEELRKIVSHLVGKLPSIKTIAIDTSLFNLSSPPDGTSNSLNPYDAKNGSFVVNFGSARLHRKNKSTVVSAEPETPLTSLATQSGMKIPVGRTDRINLAKTPALGAQYGAEIFSKLLEERGVTGVRTITFQVVPSSATHLLTHYSSKSLEEIVKDMLEYSTNFTANQIMLVLGAEAYSYPATVEKGKRALNKCLSEIGWSDFHIEEGSGLSRKTKVSPHQLVQLLKHFSKYEHLLPSKMGFSAKTGSLRGVNSLAGYLTFDSAPSEKVYFAILINSNVPHLHKYKVATALRELLEKKQ